MRTCIIWMGGGAYFPGAGSQESSDQLPTTLSSFLLLLLIIIIITMTPPKRQFPVLPHPFLYLSILCHISAFSFHLLPPLPFKLLLLLHLIHLLLAALRFSADRPYLTRGVHRAALPTTPLLLARWQHLDKACN